MKWISLISFFFPHVMEMRREEKRIERNCHGYKSLLLVVVSGSDVVAACDEGFSMTVFSLPFQKIHLLQELLLMKFQLPHAHLPLFYFFCAMQRKKRRERGNLKYQGLNLSPKPQVPDFPRWVLFHGFMGQRKIDCNNRALSPCI